MESGSGARPTASLLLGGIILSVALSPRIRVPGLLDRAVDLRVQDFLVVVALGYVGLRLPSLRQEWGPWAALFVLGASILTVVHLISDPSVSPLRMVAYLGRGLELLVLAAVVAGLFRLAGNSAGRVALGSLFAGVLANAAWMAYQVGTGTSRTLLNPDVEDIDAYGPQLVGEGSSYGTGIFCAFTAALGCACWLNRTLPRPVAAALVGLGGLGAYVAESRSALAVIGVCVLLLAVLPVGRSGPPLGLWIAGAFVVVLAYAFSPELPDDNARLSLEGIGRSWGDRTGDWYGPLLDILFTGTTPLTGIGVGRLGSSDYPYWTEAHNLVLRAFLDYGIVVGSFWLAIFATAAVRALRASTRLPAGEARLWATLAGITLTAVLASGLLQESLAAVMSTHLAMLTLGLFAGARHGPISDEPQPTSHLRQDQEQETGR